jgi:hypothetical protein
MRLGYGLDDRGSIPGRIIGFSLRHRVQTGSGAHLASYLMGTRVSFPRGKGPWRRADHSPPTNTEVKNAWSYTSTFQYVSWHGTWLSKITLWRGAYGSTERTSHSSCRSVTVSRNDVTVKLRTSVVEMQICDAKIRPAFVTKWAQNRVHFALFCCVHLVEYFETNVQECHV